MALFAGVDDDGFIPVRVEHEPTMPEDGSGPPSPYPVGPYTYYEITQQDVADLGPKPGPTSQLKWLAGAMAWVETAPLAGLQEAAIAQTYLDVDRVHVDAVGNRATEYQEAETAARAFAAAGFQGVADSDVHSFALHNPTGQVQTDQWAAEHIIAQADAFRGAQKAMRTQRFQRQAEMRAATTAGELQAAQLLWNQFITNLRGQLGLPT